MTATSLFDVLARDGKPGTGVGETGRIVPLAEKMVAVCLSDLEHLHGYEQNLELATVNDSIVELELRQTIARLYTDWVIAAEAIYGRARSLHQRGISVKGIELLNHAIGKTQSAADY